MSTDAGGNVYDDSNQGVSSASDEDALLYPPEITPLIRNLPDGRTIQQDNVILSADELRGKVDMDKYTVSHRTSKGVVVVEHKETDRIKMAASIVKARQELSQYCSSRFLHNSISFTMGYYDYDACIARVSDWVEWHSHWVYCTPVSRMLPANYPCRGASSIMDSTATNSDNPLRLLSAQPHETDGSDWLNEDVDELWTDGQKEGDVIQDNDLPSVRSETSDGEIVGDSDYDAL